MHKRRPSVLEQLFTETHRFEFYKAVRLLEQMTPDAVPVGEGADPQAELLKFQSRVDSGFSATALDYLTAGNADDPRLTLQVNFLGLAGAHGPLPAPYTDLILDRVWRGDHSLRAFLDMFNHRLISLLYRIRKTHRLGYDGAAPWQSRFADFLYASIGLGTPGLQQRMQVADHSLLHYAGLLLHEPRSLVALEKMLQDYFQVPVASQAFVGRWHTLPDSECSRLGIRGQHQRLGQGAALGNRVWDQQGQFNLRLGPLSFQAFTDFLPIGWGFMPLCDLTRLFVGPELEFDVEVVLDKAEVPVCRLGQHQGSRLGWTSWLKTQAFTVDPSVSLKPRLLLDQKQRQQIPLLRLLPPEELEAALQRMRVHHFPIHSVVVRQGEPGESLFIISHGAVQVVSHGLDGTQRVLATLEAGNFFGEFSLLSGKPRSATVITIAAAKILEFSKADIEIMMEKHPRVRQALAHFYQRRAGSAV